MGMCELGKKRITYTDQEKRQKKKRYHNRRDHKDEVKGWDADVQTYIRERVG
jgi:hypothetical protein